MRDVNFLGFNIVPYETDNFRVELQYSRGFDIFAFPEYSAVTFPGFVRSITRTSAISIRSELFVSAKSTNLDPAT